MGMVGTSRGLAMHEMSLEQPHAQYSDEQKKAKVEVSMGFVTSSSAAAAAADTDGASEAAAFTRDQSEQAHGSASGSDWPPHPANHHPNAYTNGNLFFSQVCTNQYGI
jgi:hypothetical protein